MVCLYCGGKTRVTNSRPQRRLNQTWRRHECLNCHAVFTTEEKISYDASIVVRPAANMVGSAGNGSVAGSGKNGTAGRTSAHAPVQPFNRDKLFVSLLKALGHRQTATEDATALTATVIARLLQNSATGAVSASDIVKTVILVLKPFDRAACVQYEAYHTIPRK